MGAGKRRLRKPRKTKVRCPKCGHGDMMDLPCFCPTKCGRYITFTVGSADPMDGSGPMR